jgi:hypothetical protein
VSHGTSWPRPRNGTGTYSDAPLLDHLHSWGIGVARPLRLYCLSVFGDILSATLLEGPNWPKSRTPSAVLQWLKGTSTCYAAETAILAEAQRRGEEAARVAALFALFVGLAAAQMPTVNPNGVVNSPSYVTKEACL